VKYPNVYCAVLDIAGSKGIAQQYKAKIDLLATTNDTAFAEKIKAMGGIVPPFPFSMYPPPLSTQLAAFRTFCNQSATDMVAELGGTPDQVPLAYQAIDPIYHANISIPTMTVHGTADALVPYNRSLDYQTAVAAAGKSLLYRLYLVPGGEHCDANVQNIAGSHFAELLNWSIFHPPVLASTFCNVNVMPGQTWYFFVHSAGGVGAHTYQWYEGTTLLQGQTSMVLAATKNTPGTYTYLCQVTDSEGIGVNSNSVTLTVR
jgi:hypothetical protein